MKKSSISYAMDLKLKIQVSGVFICYIARYRFTMNASIIYNVNCNRKKEGRYRKVKSKWYCWKAARFGGQAVFMLTLSTVYEYRSL